MASGDSGPKYVRVRNAIAERIADGRLVPGSRVPSISQLMAEFGVSKVTAVHALADLESEGKVRREHGRGTFVMQPDPERSAPRRESVALIVPEMKNPYHVEIVNVFERVLREQGVAVELVCTEYSVEAERSAYARATEQAHVSGVVLISTPLPHELGVGEQVRQPIVAIDYCPPDLVDRCVFVSCDNFRGGSEAADHLVSLGHTRIGYLDRLYSSRERREGFRWALERRGLRLPDERVCTFEFGRPVTREVVDLVRRERLTALFAVNDMTAMQALQHLREAGYAVPGDVALMGYDDVPAARYLDTPLTTVNQHEDLIGRRAADSLLDAMHCRTGPMRSREIVIVPQLVVRASTTPPGKAAGG